MSSINELEERLKQMKQVKADYNKSINELKKNNHEILYLKLQEMNEIFKKLNMYREIKYSLELRREFTIRTDTLKVFIPYNYSGDFCIDDNYSSVNMKITSSDISFYTNMNWFGFWYKPETISYEDFTKNHHINEDTLTEQKYEKTFSFLTRLSAEMEKIEQELDNFFDAYTIRMQKETENYRFINKSKEMQKKDINLSNPTNMLDVEFKIERDGKTISLTKEEKQKLLAIALEVNNKSEKEFEEELQL